MLIMLFAAVIKILSFARSGFNVCSSCILLKRVVQLTHSYVLPDQLCCAEVKEVRATYFDLLPDVLRRGKHLSFAHQDEEHLLCVEAASCVLAAHAHVQLQMGYVTRHHLASVAAAGCFLLSAQPVLSILEPGCLQARFQDAGLPELPVFPARSLQFWLAAVPQQQCSPENRQNCAMPVHSCSAQLQNCLACAC